MTTCYTRLMGLGSRLRILRSYLVGPEPYHPPTAALNRLHFRNAKHTKNGIMTHLLLELHPDSWLAERSQAEI